MRERGRIEPNTIPMTDFGYRSNSTRLTSYGMRILVQLLLVAEGFLSSLGRWPWLVASREILATKCSKRELHEAGSFFLSIFYISCMNKIFCRLQRSLALIRELVIIQCWLA
jgi:hypothetical protein